MNHFDLSDDEFEVAFRNCRLSPDIFSHEAHLRLAWIHITKYGLEEAEENIQVQLKEFVAFAEATDKYHTTLTRVAIRAVDHFIRQSKSENFSDYIVEFPQLRTDFKTLVNSHYSFDIFSSQKAKLKFLEPDLIPFK